MAKKNKTIAVIDDTEIERFDEVRLKQISRIMDELAEESLESQNESA